MVTRRMMVSSLFSDGVLPSSAVHTMSIVILAECFQFSFQVTAIPEEHLIKVFRTNSSDQPFDEGMR